MGANSLKHTGKRVDVKAELRTGVRKDIWAFFVSFSTSE